MITSCQSMTLTPATMRTVAPIKKTQSRMFLEDVELACSVLIGEYVSHSFFFKITAWSRNLQKRNQPILSQCRPYDHSVTYRVWICSCPDEQIRHIIIHTSPPNNLQSLPFIFPLTMHWVTHTDEWLKQKHFSF